MTDTAGVLGAGAHSSSMGRPANISTLLEIRVSTPRRGPLSMAACAGGVFVGTHELPLVADNAGQSNRLNGALDG